MATNHSRTSTADSSSRLRWAFAALAVLLIGLAVIWWPRGHKYPPATSREAYVLMDALYTACNTKNSASLDKIDARIVHEKAAGKLGASESDAFARIIALARGGKWSEANKEAYLFSQDQIGRGKLFSAEEGHSKQSAATK